MPARRRLAVPAVALALLAPLAPAPSTAAVDVCGGNWAPVLTGTTVNQGLGTYTPLVRGKTTLLRLFLTAPSCAPAGSVRLVGATAQAVEGGTTVGTSSTPTLGPVHPALDPAATGPTDDGPANPVLQFPALAAGTSTGTTTVSFRVQLTYTYSPVPGVVETRTTTSQQVASATVAPPSNGLRVLVVPMGDVGQPAREQFPTATNGGDAVAGQHADTVVQTAMQTVSRALPVPDGVADLTAVSGGLRYRLLSSSMVDLGPGDLRLPQVGGRFCMTAQSFVQPLDGPNVLNRLNAHLEAWNKANTRAKADRVVGVLWQGISGGTDQGCAEGLAVVDGTAGYLRLLAGNEVVTTAGPTPNPSMSGALGVMELAHSLGALVKGDPRSADQHHSRHTTADPTGTRRAYDTASARWLPTPMSGLRYSGRSSGYTAEVGGEPSPWDDTNVLLEREDFAFLQCELGPSLPLEHCPTGAQRGSAGLAAASDTVVLSGTTDGEPGGTQLVSARDTAGEPSSGFEGSALRAVLRDRDGHRLPACTGGPGCLDGALLLPAVSSPSSHDHDDTVTTPELPHLDVLSLHAAVPLPAGAAAVEVWRGEPGDTCVPGDEATAGCVYARRTTGAPPVVDSRSDGRTLTGLVDVTQAPGDEQSPALSRDGGLLAWQAGDQLLVQRRSVSTGELLGDPLRIDDGLQPSWSPATADGLPRLAYATSLGDIRVVEVHDDEDGFRLEGDRIVYDHVLQSSLLPTAASSPSWSPDGEELAVSLVGGVWRISATATRTNRVVCDLATYGATVTCARVVRLGTDPDWGSAEPDDLAGTIAYVRDGAVHTVAPDGTGDTKRFSGAAPSWGAGLLAYAEGGSTWVAHPGTAQDPPYSRRTRLTPSGSGDGSPSLAREVGVLALERPVEGLGLDVHVGTLGDDGDDVEFTATTTGDPDLLRGGLYLSCGNGHEPVQVAMLPVPDSGDQPRTATFRTRFAAERGCPGGTLHAAVDDGWDRSPLSPVRTFPTVPVRPEPSLAITSPPAGATYLEHQAVLAVGSSITPGDGTNVEPATRWTVTGPQGSGVVDAPVGTGTRALVDTVALARAGKAVGTWSLRLAVVDAQDRVVSSTERDYEVLPDPQHRGVNATVAFDPQTLFVPSEGTAVALRVVPARPLSAEDRSTVRITEVGGRAVDQRVIAGKSGWTANGDGSWTAKFDRAELTAHLQRSGMTGLYVQVVLQGGSGANAFVGYDPRYPRTSPAP